MVERFKVWLKQHSTLCFQWYKDFVCLNNTESNESHIGVNDLHVEEYI